MSQAESAMQASLGKRNRVVGLTTSELTTALAILKPVRSSLKELGAITESDPQFQGRLAMFGSECEETFDKILEMMETKLEGPQVNHREQTTASKSNRSRPQLQLQPPGQLNPSSVSQAESAVSLRTRKKLDKLLEMMQSNLEGPQGLSFSIKNFEHLSALKIKSCGLLQLKSDYATRAAATDELGTTEHWSSDGLHRHLNVLQDLIPKAAAARPWIDAFFFRAAAMSAPGKKLVLSLKQSARAIPTVTSNLTTAGGFTDYIAIRADEKDAEAFLDLPIIDNLKKHDHTLFVSEAKAKGLTVNDHVSLAVCEMYACAKTLGKSIIRGALTDGRDWIFIFLKMNADGDGAMYAESGEICVLSATNPVGKTIEKTWCAMIAGIIAYWIDHGNEDIGADDWFTLSV